MHGETMFSVSSEVEQEDHGERGMRLFYIDMGE